jgi:hypothetical protein
MAAALIRVHRASGGSVSCHPGSIALCTLNLQFTITLSEPKKFIILLLSRRLISSKYMIIIRLAVPAPGGARGGQCSIRLSYFCSTVMITDRGPNRHGLLTWQESVCCTQVKYSMLEPTTKSAPTHFLLGKLLSVVPSTSNRRVLAVAGLIGLNQIPRVVQVTRLFFTVRVHAAF